MDREFVIGPHQVSFDITNKCNLRCLHCYNSSGTNLQSENELSDSEVLKFIEEFRNIKLLNFCFCGGETLLRKNLILKCCKKLREYDCYNLAIVTNGILLTNDLADELISAGINKIQISLDGIKPSSHDHLRNKEGAFIGAINAIKILSEKNVDVGIAFTPTSYNIEEIIGIRNLMLEYGLSKATLRVQPLMIMGRATDNVSKILPSQAQYRKLVKLIGDLNREETGIQIDWGDPIDHLIRFTQQNFLTNNCTVRCNGEIIVDPYLPLVVGNLRKHSFTEYWNAGFKDIWNSELVKKLSECLLCIKDMDLQNNKYLPDSFKSGDIYIDLIDDDFEKKQKLLIEDFVS